MASFLVLYDTVVGRPSRRPWSRVELVGWARAGARGLTDPSLLPEELALLLVCRYLETVWVRGRVGGGQFSAKRGASQHQLEPSSNDLTD